MPRKFDTIEVLPNGAPFPAALVEDLGLRGINCGSARRLFPGWVNTDRMHLKAWDGTTTLPGRIARVEHEFFYLEFDSREPYPFEEESFDWAYAEHFVEHLTLEETIVWLSRLRTLLKPGGQVRLSTPDLRIYLEGYLNPGNGFFAEHRAHLGSMRAYREQEVPDRPAWMVNQIFYGWQHRWIFDFDEMRHAAEQAGFDPAAVTQRRFRDSAVPEMAQMDIEGRARESLYVEITRT